MDVRCTKMLPQIQCSSKTSCVLEIMMHCLDPVLAQRFVGNGSCPSQKFPGMAEILNGFETDEFNFEPCGYSMNGMHKNEYCTIHVTPQEAFSYASFETSVVDDSTFNTALVCRVLSMFVPGHFTLCLYGDATIELDTIEGYTCKLRTDMSLDKKFISVLSFYKNGCKQQQHFF